MKRVILAHIFVLAQVLHQLPFLMETSALIWAWDWPEGDTGLCTGNIFYIFLGIIVFYW